RPGRNVLDRLSHNSQAFAHLGHADVIAGKAIAGGGAADLEVQVSVGQIGLVFPQIASDTAGAGNGTRSTAVGGIVLCENPHILGAIDEDPVAVEKPFHVVERGGKGLDEAANF